MRWYERKISEEMYRRAVHENNGRLTREEQCEVLTDAERLGYGASTGSVFERDGEFFVNYCIADSCD